MPQLLVVLAILWALVYGSKILARANPTQVRQWTKGAGGIAALLGAGLLLLRGQIEVALGLGGLGAWLLGWSALPKWGPLNMFAGPKTPKGQVARTKLLEFDVADHQILGGRVIAGAFAGADFAALDAAQAEALLATCSREDPDGARLLDAYLDRRFPGWRAARQRQGDPGPGGRAARPGAMSEKEAYEILGLTAEAGRDDVTRAHRTLMKKLHPDYGGSTGLAARINEARDILLHRHT